MKREIIKKFGSRASLLCLLLAMFTVAASAQEKVEVSATFGYTATSGFTIDPVLIGNTTINKIGVDSGFAFNIQGDYLFGENAAFGFMFAKQQSALSYRGATIGGTSGTTKVADLSVWNYQFPFTYNFLDNDAKVRPYLFIGLGWTQFSPGTVNPSIGHPILNGRDLQTQNQFAMSLGGGVKYFVTPKFGIKGQARWTPTYVTSQADGYLCNFY
ncbi:MAG TPA: outer membrane beta-barrel protein [Terriglobia bacterium]|nr:outer membrane beta-barrel protein [Terriglobia bacterium]